MAALLAAAVAGSAAIRNTTSGGSPLFRTDAGDVHLVVNTGVAAGSKNADGEVDITSGSNVMQALTQAEGEWNAVSTAAVHFAPLETSTTSNNPTDGINVITIQDTSENRSMVGDLLAVTVYEYEENGAIVDSDIILNPDITVNGQQVPFSTTHALGTFDLQSVVAHEMGHTLGSDHSGLLSASMVPSIPPNDAFVGAPKTALGPALSTDDIAFVSSAYPSSKAAAQFGTIQGTITSGGQAVSGAAVIAVSPSTGRSVCALSSADGTYMIPALPVDSYVVYAQPLDGPVRPDNIYSLAGRTADTSFQMTFFGGNAAPAHLSVTAGSVSQASISAASGSPSLALPLVAIGTPDLTSWSTSGGANTVQAGQTLALLLTGTGIDSSITADDIDLLGPGLTIQSVQPAGFDINGLPALAVLVNIANNSTRGEATIVVHKGSEAAAYSGGLIIAPDSATSSGGPAFTAAGMKNAAGYQAGKVAPGEIFALFGSGLGPASAAGFSLNAQNQMPTTLGGTQVLFDGVAAPLIYSVSGEVIGVVPYGVAGQTSVVVTYKGVPSSPVTIPVSSSVPGLFTVASGGTGPASILNWLSKTGMSVNSVGDPALRGGTIVVYGTGDGFSYGFPVGTIAGSGPNENASVTATIGGVPAKVTYAGAAAGQIVGLFQVNIQVPSNAPNGAQPLFLTVNGAKSQTGVTVAVQ